MTASASSPGAGRPRRAGGALAAAAALVGLALPPTTAGAAATPPPPGGSPVTVSGQGPFAGLKVTVSQTTHLVDQVVRVSWTGGTPSGDAVQGGALGKDYLQIMQCWGNDPAGPDPTQCQYGGTPPPNGTAYEGGRRLDYCGAVRVVDPLQQPPVPVCTSTSTYVPFKSVTGATLTGDVLAQGQQNDFYGPLSTNDIPYGRTYANGTGEVFFETQTSREAPGLGCGDPLTDSQGPRAGRSCWLVVVPRGDTEVDGTKVPTGPLLQLQSSPLSPTNWKQRLVVPLAFQPIGLACAIGAHERLTGGQEQVAEALFRWQPALCGLTQSPFGYLEIDDTLARNQLGSPLFGKSGPGLIFTSRPADPALLPVGRSVVYAPVALSALTIAFNIQSQSPGNAPVDIRAQQGRRIEALNLTPRLVAKLLTQSYQYGAAFRDSPPDTNPAVAHNPLDMTRDQDFLAINPQFKGLTFTFEHTIQEVLQPLGTLDSAQAVWEWIRADSDARKFLSGQPDPWGMRVNKNYLGFVPQNTFPRSDTFCYTLPSHLPRQPPLCGLDEHPYAQDMHNAARAASRGDTLKHDAWDANCVGACSYGKSLPQADGMRSLLAFADTPTADRYSLLAANLRNALPSTCDNQATAACGAFVAATPAALLAGYAAMKPSGTPGVLLPDPTNIRTNPYPLPTVAYAATVPGLLDPAARKAYSAFVRYAVGAGQAPGVGVGQLPPGYVPLPASARSQALLAADAILNPPATLGPPSGGPPPAPSGGPPHGTPGPGSRPAPVNVNDGTGTGARQQPGAPSPAATSDPLVRPRSNPADQGPPPSTATNVSLARTPALSVGWVRYALVGVCMLGGLAAGTGPGLLKFANRTGR